MAYMVIHGGEANKSGMIHHSNTGVYSNFHQAADKQSSVKPSVVKHIKNRDNGPLSGVCPHDGLFLSGTQNNPVTVRHSISTIVKIQLY